MFSGTGQRITQRLRTRLFDSIMKQEVAFFDKNKTGELVNRLSADTALVSQCVTMNISDGLRSAVMVVAGVSMMVRCFRGTISMYVSLTLQLVYSCSGRAQERQYIQTTVTFLSIHIRSRFVSNTRLAIKLAIFCFIIVYC